MRPLDRTDRQILDILQREGRIAISELASRVNLSTTPCSERVKRLEREGIIIGYYARLNPAHVDRNLLVFLEIKLSAKSGDVFDQVARDLIEVPSSLLAFRASQTAFFAKPADKNATLRLRTRLQVHLNSWTNNQRPSVWMVFVYLVAGGRT